VGASVPLLRKKAAAPPHMNDGIHFGEFLDYIEEENRRWKQLFGRHPEALDLP
jgi:hypothetical protein